MADVFSRSVTVLGNGGFALKPGRLIVRDPNVQQSSGTQALKAAIKAEMDAHVAAYEAAAQMFEPQEPAPAAHVSGVGLSCDTCREPNEYAQANMEGGAFRCYRCRSVWA